MKKAIVIGIAVLAIGAAIAVTAPKANAQYGVTNPISQWIVLSGLFNPYITASGTGVDGLAANNPISQWIVLSGLFGGYGFYGGY